MLLWEAGRATRAIAAATSLASSLDLQVNDAVVIQNSNKLALRLLPCDVLARTARAGQDVAAFEVQIAQLLAAFAAPVASLDPRVDSASTSAMTLPSPSGPTTALCRKRCPPSATRCLTATPRGHAKSRDCGTRLQRRIAAAERLLTHRHETPALADDDRLLLLNALRGSRQAIRKRGGADQLLHGEPHSGNPLNTPKGLLFIDFETCCRGPIEFDVAHVPDEFSLHYPDVDPALLQECRRLVLAMVAAWRWDVRDEFPDGHRHGRDIIGLLREGPPWPALGALSIA